MNQSFYVKMSDKAPWYDDSQYLLCTYTTTDNAEEICILSTSDDFELSITGSAAFGAFIKLQEQMFTHHTISHDELLVMGFKQYG